MAPIKFEENIKDKLQERSLSPSEASWSHLSKRLDADENAKKKSWFWYMGVAAGLIIFLAIAIQTFGSKDANTIEPQLVDDESIENKIKDQQPYSKNSNTIELAVEDKSIEEKKDNKESIKKPEIIYNKSVVKKKPISKTQLATVRHAEKSKAETIGVTGKEKTDLNNAVVINTNAVTNAIEKIKSLDKTVTDREVDSLLKLASKKLFKDKLQKEMVKTVDAKLLLKEVEENMGQSFRTKVFKALKESYETVKTAVAERNN